jgi:uncharacterized protein YndB with AHSA1/START domain
MTDRIEKTIDLKAPVSRVWRALTDHHEFGKWFRVRLEHPFVPGQVSRGQITYPGYEHLRLEAVVTVFVHLASIRRRSQARLFWRAADAR